MSCENTYYLNEYEHYQDHLEENYMNSLPEMYDSIVEYAVKILEGECEMDDYHDTFGEYYEDHTGDCNGYISSIIDQWLDEGVVNMDNIDLDVLLSIARKALFVASLAVAEEDLDVIASDGLWSIKRMAEEVVYG